MLSICWMFLNFDLVICLGTFRLEFSVEFGIFDILLFTTNHRRIIWSNITSASSIPWLSQHRLWLISGFVLVIRNNTSTCDYSLFLRGLDRSFIFICRYSFCLSDHIIVSTLWLKFMIRMYEMIMSIGWEQNFTTKEMLSAFHWLIFHSYVPTFKQRLYMNYVVYLPFDTLFQSGSLYSFLDTGLMHKKEQLKQGFRVVKMKSFLWNI